MKGYLYSGVETITLAPDQTNGELSLHSFIYMSQQLGNEVERQGESNKSTIPRTVISFQRKEEELPWVGFESTTHAHITNF